QTLRRLAGEEGVGVPDLGEEPPKSVGLRLGMPSPVLGAGEQGAGRNTAKLGDAVTNLHGFSSRDRQRAREPARWSHVVDEWELLRDSPNACPFRSEGRGRSGRFGQPRSD